MSDWIEGPVTWVIDGDTFDMKVEWVGRHNSRQYKDTERIRLEGIDAPEAGSRLGESVTDRLQRRLLAKRVHCTVKARDTYGRLVCQVKVVTPSTKV
jgi:endonuclease YncB( thermonuclease family)